MTEFSASFLRALCLEIRAAAPDSFWRASDPELMRAYNGIGPDRWPCWIRGAVTRLLRPFQAAAFVHDWEYSLPEKSYRAFTAANRRLAANVVREALYDCRVSLIPAGIAAAVLCQLFGLAAWRRGRPKP